MTQPAFLLKTSTLKNSLDWFVPDLNKRLISPLQTTFPSFPLPSELQDVLNRLAAVTNSVTQKDDIDILNLIEQLWGNRPKIASLFKQILLLYRRDRASYLETLREKTIHLEMGEAITQEIVALDAVVNHERFQAIPSERLPRLKDFLPLQLVKEFFENSAAVRLPPRAYDEKFRILHAPGLFLHDLVFFRAKGDARDTSVTIAFIDIDNFKSYNDRYGETTIDQNLLPRLMQAIDAHIHFHGYAYRQGGDEYLMLMPNFSNALTSTFLDELRCKIADLRFPEIDERVYVSIGFCSAVPDCPLTDRELQERANRAKQFAKRTKNCLATFSGPRLLVEELFVVNRPGS